MTTGRRFRRAGWAMGLIVLILAGCRGDFPMGQVRGKVTCKGRPLPEGTIMFVPQTGLAAAGAIQADGSYRLLSRKPGDGATVGRHKVAVLPPFEPKTPGYPSFARKYRDAETGGFEVEVKEGDNVFDFELSE